MTLTSQAGKISIDVPCTVCPGNHTYTLGEDIFFGRPLLNTIFFLKDFAGIGMRSV